MRKADKASIKQLGAQTLLMLLPILMFVAPILGAVAGIYMESWTVFWMVTVIVFVAAPIKLKKMGVNKINKTYAKNWDGVVNSLKSPDYVLTEAFGGIGVDMDNKQLSILHSVGKKNAEPVIIDFDGIEEYGVTGEGYTEWESLNAGINQIGQETLANATNRAAADAKTGLYVLLKDIHAPTPKLLAAMTTETAERWMRLLKEAFNGELDKPKNSPSHFPAEWVTE